MGSRRAFDRSDDDYDHRRGGGQRHRGNGHRPPRQSHEPRDTGGFGDDGLQQHFSNLAGASQDDVEQVTGEVAWFNPDKGFGFVKLPARDDAFLAAKVLESAGYASAKPGSKIECEIRPDGRGRLAVSRVLSVDESTASARIAPGRDSAAPRKPALKIEDTVRCTVKWFDEGKGFGFMSSDNGYDVFVHIATVRRSSMDTILEGETFLVEVAQGEKGKVAMSLEATA